MSKTPHEPRRFGLTMLAALAAAALFGAGQAHAQAVGFVWNNNPDVRGVSTPDTAFSFNSSGNTISIDRKTKGAYSVLFNGLGNGLHSNIEVSAVGAEANFCVAGKWFSLNSTDVTANVDCYNKAGDPVDSSFTALYQARTSSDLTKPTVAFLLADKPTNASYTPDLNYQYNIGGGANTVVRNGTGNYTATLPGLAKAGGTVIVTAYNAAAHCQVTNWISDGSATIVNVNCTNGAGFAADEKFNLAYSIFETTGYSAGSTGGGAIWAFKDKASAAYDVSKKYSIAIDGEPMFVQRTGRGAYTWTMTVNNTWTSSTVLPTAYGAPGNYCKTLAWNSTSTVTTVNVDCFDSLGKPADTRFTATFQLAGVF